LWKKAAHNYTCYGEGFFISFLPANVDLSIFSSDNGEAETAIVKDGKYYILNGDWREQYEPLIPLGFEACFILYKEHAKDCQSSWSN